MEYRFFFTTFPQWWRHLMRFSTNAFSAICAAMPLYIGANIVGLPFRRVFSFGLIENTVNQ
ncbi:hypothetical protein QOT17_019905 [Balamuthia mandrillaris]